MKSDFFIDRPIFSTVISIVIVLVGLIGLFLLPVDQYPEIVPPVVQVSASYPGADAETVSQAVATPIEQELNGTPGMLYMDSRSTNTGSFTVTITFDIDTDPDEAGRGPTSGRGDPERHLGGQAGIQQADDHHPAVQ